MDAVKCPRCGVLIPGYMQLCACGYDVKTQTGGKAPDPQPSQSLQAPNGVRLVADNESMLMRYQDGYGVAKLINGFGQACKVVGISLGGLIFLACASATSISNFAVVIGLVFGSIVGFVGWAIGVLISAQGQIAKATLDTAVNSSPFLSNEERAKVMSLP